MYSVVKVQSAKQKSHYIYITNRRESFSRFKAMLYVAALSIQSHTVLELPYHIKLYQTYLVGKARHFLIAYRRR